MTPMPIRATGIPWYDREDYRRILKVMADANVLPPTYEKWRYMADRLERTIQSAGGIAVRAKIEARPAWQSFPWLGQTIRPCSASRAAQVRP